MGATDWRLTFVLLALLFCASDLPALPQRLGDFDEDGRATVIDLQRLINHINGSNLLPPTLLPYGDLNEDGVIDQKDVDMIVDAILGNHPLPNPFSPPLVSVPIAATNGATLVISGVSRPNRNIIITGGGGATFTVSDSNGAFFATVRAASQSTKHSLRDRYECLRAEHARADSHSAGLPAAEPVHRLPHEQPGAYRKQRCRGRPRR